MFRIHLETPQNYVSSPIYRHSKIAESTKQDRKNHLGAFASALTFEPGMYNILRRGQNLDIKSQQTSLRLV